MHVANNETITLQEKKSSERNYVILYNFRHTLVPYWSRARSVATWLAATKLGRSVFSQFVRCEHSQWNTRVQTWSSVQFSLSAVNRPVGLSCIFLFPHIRTTRQAPKKIRNNHFINRYSNGTVYSKIYGQYQASSSADIYFIQVMLIHAVQAHIDHLIFSKTNRAYWVWPTRLVLQRYKLWCTNIDIVLWRNGEREKEKQKKQKFEGGCQLREVMGCAHCWKFRTWWVPYDEYRQR